MSRNILQKDLKLLWGLAAARCSFPGCRTELYAEETGDDPAAVLGEIAHIVSASDTGPRSDPGLPEELRNRYENLVLLCSNHHTLVDKQENSYTVENLRGWKQDHEAWVRNRLTEEMPNVSFAELEVLTKGILNVPEPTPANYSPLAPEEKMKRNGLTDRIRFELTMGLSKTKEVKDYLASIAVLDADFSERLIAGFLVEYRRLRADGVEGDALFEGLRSFASLGRREFRYQAAGLAVTSYLFEACEVFIR